MRDVLDTNILMSAMIFPGGKPDQILYRIRNGDIELYSSEFILDEFDRILREKFQHSRKEAAERVEVIRRMATVVKPTDKVDVIKEKADDNRILECAVAAEADYLVTGDKAHLLPVGTFRGTKIIPPARMLEILAEE